MEKLLQSIEKCRHALLHAVTQHLRQASLRTMPREFSGALNKQASWPRSLSLALSTNNGIHDERGISSCRAPADTTSTCSPAISGPARSSS